MIQAVLKFVAAFLLRFIRHDQPKGKRLYEAIARLTTSVAIEAVCLREERDGELHVLLTRRGLKDTYAGMWHVPGSVCRFGEQPIDVLDRLAKNELGGTVVKATWVPVQPIFWLEQRGWFVSFIFLVEFSDELRDGTWFPINNLPKEFIEFQRMVIRLAAEHHVHRRSAA